MEYFTFVCPKCKQSLETPEALRGQTVSCPSCNTTIPVPSGRATVTPVTQAPRIKQCPYCSEEILATARKCKHCGTFFETYHRTAENFKFTCPRCGQSVQTSTDKVGSEIQCPACCEGITVPLPVRIQSPCSSPPQSSNEKPCPFCGEKVLSLALKCKHCGEFIDDDLRKKAHEKANRVSYNPIHQILALIRWFTGLDRLSGFRVGYLMSGVFKRHSREEIELYFLCGGPHNTPDTREVPTEWPRPWFYRRLLFFGLLVLLGFQFGLSHFENVKLLPGLIIVGAFFVPLSCGILFFEFNVLRNISLFRIIKYTMAGGILSLLAALFLFQFSGLNETFLGATSAGIIEETAKLLTAVLLTRGETGKRWILSGIVVGAAVGVGFAGFETAGYIFESLLEGQSFHETLFIRALFAPFGHVVWTAATAGAFWRVAEDRELNLKLFFEKNFVRVFVFVVLLHMFWNSGMLWNMQGYSLVYGWMISVLGSWYLVLLLVQEGLNQIKTAKQSK